MKILIFIFLFVITFLSSSNYSATTDLWCHLKTGEHIIKTFSIPQYDIFSYTLQNVKWIDHEWFAQVLFYLVFHGFGLLGLYVFKALVISLGIFIAFLLFYSPGKNKNTALFFAVLAVFALSYRSILRPEMFSWLLICSYLYVLEKRENTYILPLIQIAWVNLHGYFIIGPIMVVVYIIGAVIDRNKESVKHLAVILMLACLASLINPYFYKTALYPLGIIKEAILGQDVFIRDVLELSPTAKIKSAKIWIFWLFSILTSVSFLINIKKVKVTHILIFLSAFIAGYTAVRNMPIFIFLAMPLAIKNVDESGLVNEKNKLGGKMILSAIILAAAGVVLLNKPVNFKNRLYDSASVYMPKSACDFLAFNKINGRIFNTVDYGHYIAYRFYPHKRIFIDTRTELYKDGFYEMYIKAHRYPEEFEKLQAKYNFNIVLVRHLFNFSEPLIRYLNSNNKWSLIYYDEQCVVFLLNGR